MKENEKYKNFMEIVRQIKELGYKVYSPDYSMNTLQAVGNPCYGYIVREDRQFAYIQLDNFDGLMLSAVCQPSRDTGSGRVISKDLNPPAKWSNDGKINKDYIDFAIDFQYGKKYTGFDEFIKEQRKKWHIEYNKI